MNIEFDTLERLVPDRLSENDATGTDTLRLHIERYRFAARYARPGRLLDMACGVGYGTRLLVDECPRITATGVDISEHAVGYANEHYRAERVAFAVHDAMQYADPDGFDTIVSLETIEHVPDPPGLIRHLFDLLKPGGVLVGSVPITPSVDVNPHHLHDFTQSSFRRLFLNLGLTELASFQQVQWFNPLPILSRSEARTRDLRSNLLLYYWKNPAGLSKRVWSTVRYGFSNRYLTSVWQKRP